MQATVAASSALTWDHQYCLAAARPAAAFFAVQLPPVCLHCGAAAVQMGADGVPVHLLTVQHELAVGWISDQPLQHCLILLPPPLPGCRGLGYRSRSCSGRKRRYCCWL